MSSLLHQAKTVDGSPLKLRFNEKELSFAANCRTHPPDKEGLVSKKGPGKGQGTVEGDPQTEHASRDVTLDVNCLHLLFAAPSDACTLHSLLIQESRASPCQGAWL